MEIFRKRAGTKNRRNEPRYNIPNLAAYTEEGAEQREKLVNVSMNGCCIETPVNLKKGEHILVHFISSTNYFIIDDSFCMDGCVVWSDESTDGRRCYGLHFAHPNTDFFIGETQAFRDQLARMACQQYFSRN